MPETGTGGGRMPRSDRVKLFIVYIRVSICTQETLRKGLQIFANVKSSQIIVKPW